MIVNELINELGRWHTEFDQSTARLIAKANKFALNPGSIPKDIMDGAEDFTRQLMGNEIFPMPFDSCLFEFGPDGLTVGPDGTVSPDAESIIQYAWVYAWREIIDAPPNWAVYFRSFTKSRHNGRESIFPEPAIGQIFTDDFDESGENGYFKVIAIDTAYQNRVRKAFDNGCAASLSDVEPNIIETIRKCSEDKDFLAADAIDKMEPAFGLFLSALGLLSTSAGIQIEHVLERKHFINMTRVKKGKWPLDFEHRIIRIDPILVKLPGLVRHGGTHASPRLHWRRGHIRTLPDGRKIQVKPCIVGDVSMGTITHDYIIKPSEKPKHADSTK